MSTTDPSNTSATKTSRVRDIDDLRKKTKHLILETDDYYICIDKDNDLDWGTSEACEKSMSDRYTEEQKGFILNRVAILRIYHAEHLSEKQKIDYFIMVGEGLARGFDEDAKTAKAAMSMLDQAEEYGSSMCRQVARCWYLNASYATTAIFAVLIVIGWLGKTCWNSWLGQTAAMLLFGACFGALGALLSILQRVGKTPLNPKFGRGIHYKEAVNRILAGVMAAGVVELAIKVGLIIPFLIEKGLAAYVLVSFVAGISERLLPSIIGRIESTVASASDKRLEPEQEAT